MPKYRQQNQVEKGFITRPLWIEGHGKLYTSDILDIRKIVFEIGASVVQGAVSILNLFSFKIADNGVIMGWVAA